MKITYADLKRVIQETSTLVESEEFAFRPGEIVKLIRPVRVTPRQQDGKWEGGEDSPGSRRTARPRGTTSTILKPGTQCKVLKAGKNQAWVTPLDDDGSELIDPQSDRVIDQVLIHINKFSQSAADAYKAGRPKAQQAPGSGQSKEAQLQAQIAKLQAQLDSMKAPQQSDDPWDEKTNPDF